MNRIGMLAQNNMLVQLYASSSLAKACVSVSGVLQRRCSGTIDRS